jgi:acyl-CoA synthetase (AMP-forming)/AMP-acid ligase II
MRPDTLLSLEQLMALRSDSTMGCGNLVDKVFALQTCTDSAFIFLQRPVVLPDGRRYSKMSLDDLMVARMTLAHWYLSIGVGTGDVVTVCLSDGIAPFLHYIALCSLGAVACVVNARMSSDMAADYLISNGFFTIVLDDAVRDEAPAVRFLRGGTDSRFCIHNVSEAKSPSCKRSDLPGGWPYAPADNTLVMLSHTSGTTGTSKAVKFEHRQFFMGKRDRLGRFLETNDERFLTALPPSHSSAISHLETAILHGVPTYIMSDCTGPALRAAIRDFEPTLVAGFPQTYADLVRGNPGAGEFDSVRRWLSMGDAMHGAHIARLLVGSPRARFFDCFGSSELGMAVFQKESTLDNVAPSRCVGRPVGIAVCKVISRTSGVECADSELGLLSVRSPTITAGYWNQDERTAASWRNGYFLTGDVGFVKDGQYYLVDRTSDVLRFGGSEYYTLLIEERLQRIPGVFDAVVIGVESDAGPAICALILTAGASGNSDGLMQICAGELQAALRPLPEGPLQLITVVTDDPGSIPTGPTGKVLKRRLAQLAQRWASNHIEDDMAKSSPGMRLSVVSTAKLQ